MVGVSMECYGSILQYLQPSLVALLAPASEAEDFMSFWFVKDELFSCPCLWLMLACFPLDLLFIGMWVALRE